METWNREELYNEIWQEPAMHIAKKYGISGVMLGKICRKLSIPVPGRGYWARKQNGQTVASKPLPKLKNVPLIERHKIVDPNSREQVLPEPEPADAEYLRILEVEANEIEVDAKAPLHALVAATVKAYKSAQTDHRGYLTPNWESDALPLRVSRGTYDRAILILNTVVRSLDKHGFPVTLRSRRDGTVATIDKLEVGFELVEKYRQIRLEPKSKQNEYTYPKMKYEPNGILEFRVSGGGTIQDGKRKRVEQQIARILGAFLRAARASRLRAEEMRLREIARRKEEEEHWKLSEQIRKEEAKLAELDQWVNSWVHARNYREFISALEKNWQDAGEDVSPDSEHGKRLTWMREQADRLDPLVKSPASILDRKREVRGY